MIIGRSKNGATKEMLRGSRIHCRTGRDQVLPFPAYEATINIHHLGKRHFAAPSASIL
jgi:hypothetical protein